MIKSQLITGEACIQLIEESLPVSPGKSADFFRSGISIYSISASFETRLTSSIRRSGSVCTSGDTVSDGKKLISMFLSFILKMFEQDF